MYVMLTSGLRPAAAAPTPIPTIPASETGVSRTRTRAELLIKSREFLVGAAEGANVLAENNHVFVTSHLFGNGPTYGLSKEKAGDTSFRQHQ